MLAHFINIQYCYNYLIGQIPVGLLLYSHIPTALLALLFGVYILIKSRDLVSFNLFIVCFLFAISCFFDLGSWFSFLGSANTMLLWSLIDLSSLLFFFFSYYFLYVFVTKHDLPIWQKILGIIVILPTTIWTFLGSNLKSFNLNTCEAIENSSVTNYLFYAEGIIVVAVIALIIFQYRKNKNEQEKRKVVLAGTGVGLFLLFFLTSTLVASIFLNYESLAEYAYNYEIYGLFGMPLLLAFLGYLVVKYKAFNLKIFGAQALIFALVALIGAQFFFIQTNTNRILTGITLIVLGIVGINLMRSVKREIESREKIEKLAKELQEANEKLRELDQLKSEFLSLATHQLRAPLTAIKGYSSMLAENDFGILPTKATDAASTITKSCQNLINIVEDFLNISRIEQGRMVYDKTDFDIVELTKEVIKELTPNIEKAGLHLETQIPISFKAKVNADKTKTKQIISNIIDNAIKYTPHGQIVISVFDENNKVKISIKDSGIGIDPNEVNKLFNKFSRAKDAGKTNVHGTGLGLYIAKKMAEAQSGDIKVSSEGLGKGTAFTIELPLCK